MPLHLTATEALLLGVTAPPAKKPKKTPEIKAQEQAAGSALERTFWTQWLIYWNITPSAKWHPTNGMYSEFQFDKERGWRFDFACPRVKVAVECEGRGHQKENRYTGDIEKYNAAAAQGWAVLRCTSAMLRDDPQGFIQMVVDAIKERTQG